MRDQELRELRYAKYKDIMNSQPHTVQISFQRSGRNWLAGLIQLAANIEPQKLDLGEVDFFLSPYITTHLYPHYEIGKPRSARYVVVIRDPRDVLRSQMEWSITAEAGDRWDDKNLVKNRARHWKDYLSILQHNSIMIQYERLCLYPVGTIKRVLAFSGLEVKDDITKIIERFDLNRGHQLHRTGLDRYETHCQKWKTDNRLLPNFNDLVWDIAGDVMVHYGYLNNGHSVNLLTE